MLRGALLAVAAALVVGAVWVACERQEHGRWRFSHGHGYWSVRELVPNRRDFWERFAHYERLFDGPVDLGLVDGGFSVSPGGAFAAFDRDGVVLIYNRHEGMIDTLALRGDEDHGFRWDVAAKTVAFRVSSGRDTVIHLGTQP